MYNADRRTKEYIDGMHSFLEVAKANKSEKGFICCPCSQCKNTKDYSNWGTLHHHLLRYGFMPNYVVWTKHGERGVIMEDGEEEEDDNNIPDWVASQAFADTTMGEADEEELPEDDPTDDLAQVLRDAQRDCGENVKEVAKLQCMIDDKNFVVPRLQAGA